MTHGCGFSGGLQNWRSVPSATFWLAEVSAQYCTDIQMRRKTRVTKAEAAKARGTTQRKTVTLIASVEVPKNAHVMVEQFQRMYKARKKAVTLRLDADVLARFKRQGRAIRRGSIRRCGGVMWEGGNRGSKGLLGLWRPPTGVEMPPSSQNRA
jgi:uncharacterized protein (DUF4415 family)